MQKIFFSGVIEKMSEYTTIQVTKDVRDKLESIKSVKGKKYNEVIKDLLENKRGELVDDVITIERESVALTLRYWKMDNENDERVFDITYSMLRDSEVGTVFQAEEYPDNSVCYINCSAEIVFRRGEDVLLLVKEFINKNKGCDCVNSVVHVKLF